MHSFCIILKIEKFFTLFKHFEFCPNPGGLCPKTHLFFQVAYLMIFEIIPFFSDYMVSKNIYRANYKSKDKNEK